ncbi:RDD family protein [Streptomyces cinnamoneus]|uniref:RDD family protein n=1 Tax=Streptomyces cinnamoneus TaxID=53446 RepID=UPI00340EC976
MTSPDGAGDIPRAGYYPDPSIPGYIRYWSGTAWVPGTSRPAPAKGEPMPSPPASVAAAPLPALAAPVPPTPRQDRRPVVQLPDETGPVFLDEEPELPEARADSRSGAWQADTAQQDGFGREKDRRVSWGGSQGGSRSGSPGEDRSGGAGAGPALPRARDPRLPEPAAAEPPAQEARPAAPATPAQEAPVPGQGTLTLRPKPHGAAPGGPPAPLPAGPRTAAAQPAPQVWPEPQAAEAPERAEVASLPARRPASAPVPADRPQPRAQTQPQPVGWAQQVQQLAQQPQPGAGEAVAPWKPPKEDPFLLLAAQAQGRPAGLGRRLAARLLDTVVLGGAVGAVAAPLWGKSVEHIDAKVEEARQSGETVTVWLLDGTTGTYLAIVLAVLLVGGLLYEALPTAKWGRTLGKKVFGLRVLDIESHDTASFGAALRRWLVYGLLGAAAVGVLGVLWCLFDRPWRQCWHDKAARTFVATAKG